MRTHTAQHHTGMGRLKLALWRNIGSEVALWGYILTGLVLYLVEDSSMGHTLDPHCTGLRQVKVDCQCSSTMGHSLDQHHSSHWVEAIR